MEARLRNGALDVRLSEAYPRCLVMTFHGSNRNLDVQARYVPKVEFHEPDEEGRAPYISLSVIADEKQYETPSDEQGGAVQTASHQTSFLDVWQARQIVKALSDAIADHEATE